MTEIVTFINEVAHVTWPAFIIAFWITLAMVAIWAVVSAIAIAVRSGYRALKVKFGNGPRYHMKNLRRL